MAGHKVAVFGVPTAAGGHGPGVERAPFALREAGLLAALKAQGGTGMALALALGRGDPIALAATAPAPAVQPAHVALVGFRELDPGERAPLGELGLALPASAAHKLGMRVTAALALESVENGDGPVVV